MFDIGFSELLLIVVIGLVVLGPERLPQAIRTCALWISRIKRAVGSMRAEIEREIGADEIRQQIHNESIMADLRKAQQQVNENLENLKRPLDIMPEAQEERRDNAVSASSDDKDKQHSKRAE